MHYEHDSLSILDLQLYWNPNQSSVQTGNRTWVDCVEVKSTNHSASNTSMDNTCILSEVGGGGVPWDSITPPYPHFPIYQW